MQHMTTMKGWTLSKLIICLWSIYRFILSFLYCDRDHFYSKWLLILITIFFLIVKGRALLNAIGNLQLSGPYAEALRKLGHNLEDVANKVSSYYNFLLLLETMKWYNFCLSVRTNASVSISQNCYLYLEDFSSYYSLYL